MWKQKKYFKKAIETLGLQAFAKQEKATSFEDWQKILKEWEIYLDREIANLAIARENISAKATTKLSDAKKWLADFEAEIAADKNLDAKKRKSLINEVNDFKDNLAELEENIEESKKAVAELPSHIEQVQALLTILEQVEPEMKIQRVHDLNKKKNIKISVV